MIILVLDTIDDLNKYKFSITTQSNFYQNSYLRDKADKKKAQLSDSYFG